MSVWLLQSGIVLGETAIDPIVSSDVLLLGLKSLFLLAFLLYVVFAFIAARQIQIMRKTIITPFSPILQVVGYAHLALAVSIFLLFLVVL
jgi:uncharacterized membrane protein YcaP (DUF421 family)